MSHHLLKKKKRNTILSRILRGDSVICDSRQWGCKNSHAHIPTVIQFANSKRHDPVPKVRSTIGEHREKQLDAEKAALPKQKSRRKEEELTESQWDLLQAFPCWREWMIFWTEADTIWSRWTDRDPKHERLAAIDQVISHSTKTTKYHYGISQAAEWQRCKRYYCAAPNQGNSHRENWPSSEMALPDYALRKIGSHTWQNSDSVRTVRWTGTYTVHDTEKLMLYESIGNDYMGMASKRLLRFGTGLKGNQRRWLIRW